MAELFGLAGDDSDALDLAIALAEHGARAEVAGLLSVPVAERSIALTTAGAPLAEVGRALPGEGVP